MLQEKQLSKSLRVNKKEGLMPKKKPDSEPRPFGRRTGATSITKWDDKRLSALDKLRKKGKERISDLDKGAGARSYGSPEWEKSIEKAKLKENEYEMIRNIEEGYRSPEEIKQRARKAALKKVKNK